jgi:hypothetical protein
MVTTNQVSPMLRDINCYRCPEIEHTDSPRDVVTKASIRTV